MVLNVYINLLLLLSDQKPSILQIKAALGLLMVGIQNDYLMENLDIVESDSIRGPVIPSEEIIAQLSVRW